MREQANNEFLRRHVMIVDRGWIEIKIAHHVKLLVVFRNFGKDIIKFLEKHRKVSIRGSMDSPYHDVFPMGSVIYVFQSLQGLRN